MTLLLSLILFQSALIIWGAWQAQKNYDYAKAR